jgi:hypothetical protein
MSPVGDDSAVEVGDKLAIGEIDTVDVANVAVIDFLVIIVLDLLAVAGECPASFLALLRAEIGLMRTQETRTALP